MTNNTKISLFCFILLVSVQLLFSIILDAISVDGPSSVVDIILIPVIISLVYLFLLRSKRGISAAWILASIHLIVWGALLVLDVVTGARDSEFSALYLLNTFNGTFACWVHLIDYYLLESISDINGRYSYLVLTNLILVSFYIFLIASLSRKAVSSVSTANST